jgi:hypothetical protein
MVSDDLMVSDNPNNPDRILLSPPINYPILSFACPIVRLFFFCIFAFENQAKKNIEEKRKEISS